MRLPRTEADPAELGLAVRILAHHVVAAAVLLDGRLTLGAFLQQEQNPESKNHLLEVASSIKNRPTTVGIQSCSRAWCLGAYYYGSVQRYADLNISEMNVLGFQVTGSVECKSNRIQPG